MNIHASLSWNHIQDSFQMQLLIVLKTASLGAGVVAWTACAGKDVDNGVVEAHFALPIN